MGAVHRISDRLKSGHEGRSVKRLNDVLETHLPKSFGPTACANKRDAKLTACPQIPSAITDVNDV